MKHFIAALLITCFASASLAADFSAVDRSMQQFVERKDIAGAVTLVVARDKVLHLGVVGQADLGNGTPMRPDTIFWIASMTKPVTATAVMMLQDEGKLSVEDPVGKYIPELKDLKTQDGKPANLTLRHLLTHTGGLGVPNADGSDIRKSFQEAASAGLGG